MSRNTVTEISRANARRYGVGLAAVLGVAVLVAAPARAGNEFRNGFEEALGHIAAFHVAVGGAVLHHAVHPHVSHHTVVHRVAPKRHHGRYRHDRREHRRGHYHSQHDYRRGIPPCEIEHGRIAKHRRDGSWKGDRHRGARESERRHGRGHRSDRGSYQYDTSW